MDTLKAYLSYEGYAFNFNNDGYFIITLLTSTDMENISDLLINYRLEGLVIGLSTFLIIGLFHPLVIKGEYYFGEKVKWWFLVAGVIFLICSVVVEGLILSSLFGVASFSSFWGIKEVTEQTERVRKGWFPANPKRSYTQGKSKNLNEETTGKS